MPLSLSILVEPTLGTRCILGALSSERQLEQSSISMPQIGTIFLPKANGAIECLIQEITATGARLKLAAASPSSASFSVRFTQRDAPKGVGCLVGHRGRRHPFHGETEIVNLSAGVARKVRCVTHVSSSGA